jgi:hypothetical protein
VQFHQPVALKTGQGSLQPLLLLPCIQRVLVTRAGDHAQDPQRRRHPQRLPGCQHLEIAHQGHGQAQVVLLVGIEEELPRQPGQLWRAHP